MTSEHQRQSLHYFHMYGVLDRVKCVHLEGSQAVGDVKLLPESSFLPTPEDCKQLRSNFAMLLGRLLVARSPYFNVFVTVLSTTSHTGFLDK